jgi:molybdate transport system permease protein
MPDWLPANAPFWLSAEEWQAVRLSLGVAGRSVLVSLLPAVLVAWALERGRFAGRVLLDAIVHLPLVVPPVVVGWALLMLFGVRGPIGAPLNEWFGLRLVFTTEAATLATAVMSFPLIVRNIRLGLHAVDRGLEAAARSLGARPLQVFLRITLPLMSPGLLAGCVTAFAAGLGEFGAVITFAANIPGETQTLPLAIYTATQTVGGEATAARLAAVSFSLAILLLLLAEAIARRTRRFLGFASWTGATRVE